MFAGSCGFWVHKFAALGNIKSECKRGLTLNLVILTKIIKLWDIIKLAYEEI